MKLQKMLIILNFDLMVKLAWIGREKPYGMSACGRGGGCHPMVKVAWRDKDGKS